MRTLVVTLGRRRSTFYVPADAPPAHYAARVRAAATRWGVSTFAVDFAVYKTRPFKKENP